MTTSDPSIRFSPGNAVRDTVVVERNREEAGARGSGNTSEAAPTPSGSDVERSQTLRTLVLSATLEGLQSIVDGGDDRQDQLDRINSATESAESELSTRRNQLALRQFTEGVAEDAPAPTGQLEEAREAIRDAPDPQVRALSADPDVADFLNQDFDLDSIEGVDAALAGTERARDAVSVAAAKFEKQPETIDRSLNALSEVLDVPAQAVLQGGEDAQAEQTAQHTATALSRLSLPLTVGVESQLRGY